MYRNRSVLGNYCPLTSIASPSVQRWNPQLTTFQYPPIGVSRISLKGQIIFLYAWTYVRNRPNVGPTLRQAQILLETDYATNHIASLLVQLQSIMEFELPVVSSDIELSSSFGIDLATSRNAEGIKIPTATLILQLLH